MARPLRLEFPGAVFHVTSRGNERKPIFRCDADRLMFVALLGEAVRRFDWMIHAYVLMSTHFHLVIETPRETLSEGMHWLNGTYAQWFNRKYKRVGHLLQGRFSSFLIEKESYLAEVMRYVVLNPVRAKMVERPEDHCWSSYRAMAGLEPAPGRELWGQGFAWRFSLITLCHGVTSSPSSLHDILRHPLPDHGFAPPEQSLGSRRRFYEE